MMGFYKAIAIITLPNEASLAFHKAVSFEPFGIKRNVHYKFNTLHDTTWWDICLQKESFLPQPIIGLEELIVQLKST